MGSIVRSSGIDVPAEGDETTAASQGSGPKDGAVRRVCIVTQYLGLGGGEHAKLLSFLRFAEARGWTCDVYYPLEGPRPLEREQQARTSPAVDGVYPVRIHYRAPHFWRAYEFARRCELRQVYDLHVLIATPLLLGQVFVRRRQPFTAWISCTLREELKGLPRTRIRHYLLYNPVTRWLATRQERACSRQASLILGISKYTASHVRRDLGVPADKVQVIPVPVDPELFAPGEPRRHPRPYMLSVARLDRRKDFPTLLRAFRSVRRHVDVELHIVGSGPERTALEHLVESMDLEEDVRFLGEVESPVLRDEYAGATLFALSSRQEGLGIVLLEAMAAGLPVVATDSGGSADPVVHDETGFLVAVGDSTGLADAMLRLLRDPELAQRMGEAGRERVMRHFSISVVHELLGSTIG